MTTHTQLAHLHLGYDAEFILPLQDAAVIMGLLQNATCVERRWPRSGDGPRYVVKSIDMTIANATGPVLSKAEFDEAEAKAKAGEAVK